MIGCCFLPDLELIIGAGKTAFSAADEEIMNRLHSFKESPLLRDFSPAELDLLQPFFKEKNFSRGSTIFLENMPGEALFIIGHGSVRISRMLAEGEEKTLAVFGPEEFFGEMAILEEASRAATARAEEDAQLFSLRKPDYEILCDQFPKLALKLMRNIVRVLVGTIRNNDREYRRMLAQATAERS